MNSIERLNDDCLQKIFDYVPLSQLLVLELVHPRWKRLIQYRNERQISLKLFYGKTELDSYNRNDHFFYQLKTCPYFQQNNDFMLVTHLNYLSCQLLLSKYPNLKMLFISGCLFQPHDLMMMLIELKQLECFTLIICNKPSEELYFNAMIKMIKICLSLDYLPTLKHFAISLAHNTLTNPFSIDFVFKIEELYLNNVEINFNEYFEEEIKEKDLKLRKLAVFNQKKFFNMDDQVCERLARSVKQLTMLFESKRTIKNKFELISNHFGSLTYLDVYLKYCVELKLLYKLNKLTNLKEFRMRADENCAIVKDEPEDEKALNESSRPVLTVQSLHLDVDFEPFIFALLPPIFPTITHLTVNASRVCCTCPNIPEYIDLNKEPNQEQPTDSVEIQPNSSSVNQPAAIAENNVDDNRIQQQPPPQQESTARATANDSGDNIEYELDNCLSCFEHTIKTIGQWNSLSTLSIIGARLKDEALDPLKTMPRLRSLSLTNCEEFSLRPLLNVCYQIAKNRPTKQSTFVLKLNDTYFNKIIQLPSKPANLLIYNVSPALDMETEMKRQKVDLLFYR